MALIDLYDLAEMDELMTEYYEYDPYEKSEPYPKRAFGGDYWFDEITRQVKEGACSNCGRATNRFDILVSKRLCKLC